MLCLARSPVETLDLICQDDTTNLQAIGNRDFERIAFDSVGDGTQQGQADPLVVGERGDH